MGFALRAGVTCCDVEGRYVFLDLDADRYFALSGEGEAAVRALRSGTMSNAATDLALRRLCDGGPLVQTAFDTTIDTCAAPSQARASLLDAPLRAVPLTSVLRAGAHLLRVKSDLRRLGLAAVTRRTEALTRPLTAPGDSALGETVAFAFLRLGALVTAHDQCLPRSIALARHLIALGVRPTLVIAVRLAPFKAHCWVQIDDLLLNERPEVTRTFTPIRVI
jgi:hypothetical protein